MEKNKKSPLTAKVTRDKAILKESREFVDSVLTGYKKVSDYLETTKPGEIDLSTHLQQHAHNITNTISNFITFIENMSEYIN